MLRLYINQALQENQKIIPDIKQQHYLQHVMRLKESEELLVFNNECGEWLCQFHLDKKSSFLMTKHQTRAPQTRLPVILCPALIKNMEIVLQKATEMGVSEIYPIITQRSVVRKFNLQRGLSILQEASEQSERIDVPLLHDAIDLKELPKMLPENATLFLMAERQDQEEAVFERTAYQTPAFVIGPEGGFTPQEISFLTSLNQTKIIHLPDTILRAETASLAILACWQYPVFK